jgi:hypothetical protein
VCPSLGGSFGAQPHCVPLHFVQILCPIALGCVSLHIAIMLAQPVEKNTLLNGFSAFNVSLHCSVLKPLWAIQTLWAYFAMGFQKNPCTINILCA